MDNTNVAMLKGTVKSAPIFSHSLMDENFYVFPIEVLRLSGSFDTINVTLSEKLLKITEINVDDCLEISGQFRSYNNYSGVGNKLILTLFAREIIHIDSEDIGDIQTASTLTDIYANHPFIELRRLTER